MVDVGASEELITVVDELDVVIGGAHRQVVHKLGLLHREFAIYILHEDKLLLQFRADFPKYDHSCAGHVSFGETYEECALREVWEELGLVLSVNDLIYLGKEKFCFSNNGKINNRFVSVFLARTDHGLLNIDPAEVLRVDWFDVGSLQGVLKSGEISSVSKDLIERYISSLMIKRN